MVYLRHANIKESARAKGGCIRLYQCGAWNSCCGANRLSLPGKPYLYNKDTSAG